MNIQIIGTMKSNDTKKAVRFFKERNVSFHFLNLSERKLSAGELSNIAAGQDPADLLDTASPSYRKRGMVYMEYNPVEEILEDNSLLKIPVVRNGKNVTVGLDIKTWEEWIGASK